MFLIITHKMNIPEDYSRYSSYLLLSSVFTQFLFPIIANFVIFNFIE